MDWNPNKPDLIGLEFAPRSAEALPAYRIDAAFRTAAQRLDATVTETVSTLGAFIDADTAASMIMAEVLRAGEEVSDDLTTTIFRPTELSEDGDGDWETQSGSTSAAALLAVLNRANPDPSQYVHLNYSSTADPLGFQFDLAGALTGRRIVDVRFVMIGGDNGIAPDANSGDEGILVYIEGAGGGFTIDAILRDDHSGNAYNVAAFRGPMVTELATMGELYPITDGNVGTEPQPTPQPWTLAQLQALDAGGAKQLTLSVNEGNGSGTTREVKIFTVHLEVDHVAENRLSRDLIRSTAVGRRWITWTPHKPDGSANLAKVNGQDLVLVLRRPYYGQLNGYATVPMSYDLRASFDPADYSWGVPYIEALTPGGPPGLDQYSGASLNPNGTVGGLGTPPGDRIIGTEMRVAGVQSVDAQPYVTATPVLVSGTVQQEVSGATADDYGGVVVACRYDPDNAASGDLTVTLKRRSDNMVMATATISQALADQFPEDATAGWRRVLAQFDATATLAAATQYYLAFTAEEPGEWEVAAMTGIPALGSPVTGVATYGGTADVATYGGGDVSAGDIAAMVYVLPDPISGLTIEARSDPVVGAGETCTVTAIGKLTLAWDATEDEGLSVEIQRSDDTTEWQTIALITDADVDLFDDFEARITEESCYRVRTVSKATGITSDWSATVCATREAFGCGYTFTSNEYPDRNVAYGDIYDSEAVRTYEFPEADERVFRTVYGRDFQLGFRPLERRGMKFSRLLLVSALTVPDRPGPGAFDRLRDLAAAATSYVCVCDEDGNRWYATIDVPSAKIRRPGEFAYAEIVVTEVTDIPSIPDVVSP